MSEWRDTGHPFWGGSTTIWVSEAGKFAWRWNDTAAEFDGWHVSASIGPLLNGVEAEERLYNGKPCFDLTGRWVWYDGSQWIASTILGCACAEDFIATGFDEDGDPDEWAYAGDVWYSSPTIEGRYVARGANRGEVEGEYNGTPFDCLLGISGHRHKTQATATPIGLYDEYSRTAVYNTGTEAVDVTATATDPATPAFIGLPQWTDQNDTEYTRSLDLVGTHYTYGTVHHDGTGWIIGTRNSGTWYEGGEPSVSAPVVFYFHSVDPDATGYDLTLTFDAYVLGDNKEQRPVTQAGIWV